VLSCLSFFSCSGHPRALRSFPTRRSSDLLAGVVGGGADDGMTLCEHAGEQELRIPGTISADLAAELEEAIWGRMHFASHLRMQRLGEFTIGSDLRRSDSLALTQLLLLYHLVTARAVIALGGHSARTSARTSKERNQAPDRVPASTM